MMDEMSGKGEDSEGKELERRRSRMYAVCAVMGSKDEEKPNTWMSRRESMQIVVGRNKREIVLHCLRRTATVDRYQIRATKTRRRKYNVLAHL